MAISVFGVASQPADLANFNATSQPCVITPPASMVAGQLAIIFSDSMSANAARIHEISQAGGQTWNTYDRETTGFNIGIFWCQFNGTWSANPSISETANVASEGLQAAMLVVSPSGGSPTWSVDSSSPSTFYSAPASPFNVTVPGVTTGAANTIAIPYWFTGVTALPSPAYTLQTAGWAAPAGVAQWRNASRGTIALGVQVFTAPTSTGSVTNQMSASQGGWDGMIVFTDGVGAGSRQSSWGMMGVGS